MLLRHLLLLFCSMASNCRRIIAIISSSIRLLEWSKHCWHAFRRDFCQTITRTLFNKPSDCYWIFGRCFGNQQLNAHVVSWQPLLIMVFPHYRKSVFIQQFIIFRWLISRLHCHSRQSQCCSHDEFC